ncbi:MAG: hypothetical protein IT259_07010 [Saprospiraceae bacterium]|nr:hypothetical protein [Saprospiraceae bacterium]
MNTRERNLLVRTALLGTARAPLPAELLARARSWGLPTGVEPARLVLDLLAMAAVQHKAGALLTPLPAVEPAPIPENAPAPTVTGNFFERILTGDHGPALDELLALLRHRNFRLPPEYLPLLLDRSVQDSAFFAKIKALLSPLGEWLAAQNPHWLSLYEQPEQIWLNGRFADRLRWLLDTRTRNPILALALLEKSWKGEKPEHKVRLLQALQTRLGPLDEDFLEKILLNDKRREPRLAALELLLQIPESRQRSVWTAFFRERLAGIFDAEAPETFLKKHLPEIDEAPVGTLVALLPENEVKNWRMSAAAFLLSSLPPADILPSSPEQMLQKMELEKAMQPLFRNLVYGAVRYGGTEWQSALLRFRARTAESSLWSGEALLMLLQSLPDAGRDDLLVRLLGHRNSLVQAAAPEVRALLEFTRPWSYALLEAFSARLPDFTYPQEHHRALLLVAAYHCRPADAEALRYQFDPGRQPGWRHDLSRFYEVVQFRRRMHAAFDL